MIKLAVPDIGEEELNEVKKVFDSKYLVQGDKVEEFESLIKDYLKVKYAFAVTSGTAALHLALIALDIKQGDEVIIPDFTFPATSNVVEIVGASSKFVDIKLSDFCIDSDLIERKITTNTKAIIPVHEFGQSCDMNKIMKIAKRHNLKIIEDAACALGAEYKNFKVGTIGDIGCFSLHPRKAITTGEGGILTTNNDELAKKIILLRNHGLTYINGKAQFVIPGYNYRMTNIQGAIGIVQMKKLHAINEARKSIALKYNEMLSEIPNIILPKEKTYNTHVWQTYQILLDKKYNRDQIIGKLRDKGIETNYGAYSVHNQPYYKEKYNYSDLDYQNATFSFEHGLVLPLHNFLTDNDLVYITCELERSLNG